MKKIKNKKHIVAIVLKCYKVIFNLILNLMDNKPIPYPL